MDRLTRVTYTDDDGNVSTDSLTYDKIGNPLTYFNGHEKWNFTWKFGRQLTNATDGTNVISYTYDMDGIRQSKTVNGNTTKYTTLDGKVVRETNGNVKTDYFYDNEGKPYKIVVKNNTTTYIGYYALNQQGDVIAILDEYGNVAVSYEYNAWGRILSESGTGTVLSMELQSYNHLKYRGYYYDAETGFYYVSSRYYDPVIGRFINADTADTVLFNPISVIDKNLYSYCDNNPVNRSDKDGEFWNVVIGAVVGGAISAGFEIANQLISQKVTGEKFDWGAVGCSALSGAITGGFKASGLGPLGQTIGDAIATGITSTYEEYKKGDQADYRAVAVDILWCFVDFGLGKVDTGFGQHHKDLLEQKN